MCSAVVNGTRVAVEEEITGLYLICPFVLIGRAERVEVREVFQSIGHACGSWLTERDVAVVPCGDDVYLGG